MSFCRKDKYQQLVFSSNEYVVASSLLYLHYYNVEDSEKQYVVANNKSEAIIPSYKITFFISAWLIL